MIDTNALLSIAFSLIAQFVQVVKVPQDAIPRTTNDLQSFGIGSPYSPIEVYLIDRKGTQFWIRNGVVQQYISPGTFYYCPGGADYLSGAAWVSQFTGRSALSSNEVVALSQRLLSRLAKSPWPPPDFKPVPEVDHPGPLPDGRGIPFYWVHWVRKEISLTAVTDVEIDARSGAVVELCVDFADWSFARTISNRVYQPEPATAKSPEPARPKGIRRDLYPLPTTNQVLEAIGGWLKFCRTFGLDPGGETNLSDVVWERTMLTPEPELTPLTNLCQVEFRNGAVFQSINGTAISFLGSDVIAMGIRGLFRETNYIADYRPRKNWKELAAKCETLVVERAGVPRSVLEDYHAVLDYGDGIHFNYRHCLVDWCKKGPEYEHMIPYERPMAMSAEFDLDTGQVKGLNFLKPVFEWWQKNSSVVPGGK